GTTIVEGAADGDVVEEREVLHVLAKTDAARVWAHRNAELGGEEEHRQHLVHTAQAAAIDLTESDRPRLHQLLEDDAVLTLLSGRDADRRDRARNRGVPEDVVGARRLLD